MSRRLGCITVIYQIQNHESCPLLVLAVVVFLAMSVVVWPFVGLLGGDAADSVLPDLDADGRPT